MARTGTPLPLIASMQNPMAPPTSRASPVPSKASTIRSCCGSSAASKACGTMPAAMAASAAVRASPLSRPRSAHSSTVTASPAAWARRATTYPSPALLPAPHTTANRLAAGQRSRRTAKAAAPARSMRVMPAMPRPSMAARSSRRTPSAVYRDCGSRSDRASWLRTSSTGGHDPLPPYRLRQARRYKSAATSGENEKDRRPITRETGVRGNDVAPRWRRGYRQGRGGGCLSRMASAPAPSAARAP